MQTLTTGKMNKLLKTVVLKKGSHKSFEQGACVMEMVSYIANEPWSDRPNCACPILTDFAIRYNDRVPDKQRQKLKSLIPKLMIGTEFGMKS